MTEFKTISRCGRDKRNEDFILCHQLSDDGIIAILADGMGGLSYGAEAAEIISKTIMTTILNEIQYKTPEDALLMAFDAADAIIYKKCREMKCKMGAAVTAAIVIKDFLYYAWQGNVRIYKASDRKPILLNTDHIIAETGGISLTRCINGKGYRDKVPVRQEKLKPNDRIFICSDGLYQHINLSILVKQDIKSASDIQPEDDASLIIIKNFNPL